MTVLLFQSTGITTGQNEFARLTSTEFSFSQVEQGCPNKRRTNWMVNLK